MRYVLDFGSANAGGAPAFTLFARVDTVAALAPPAIHEIGAGQYYFDFDWNGAAAGLTSITYKAVLNGIELSDVISGTPGAGSTVITPGVASLLGFSTAGDIVSRAARQLGLGDVPDPYASSDPNIAQLREYMRTVADDLGGASGFEWPQLRREATFLTIAGQSTYALPQDFEKMIDQSGWNRSARLPLIGPLSPQEWQYLKARALGMYITVVFRQGAGVIEINPGMAVAGGVTVAFEYISNFWVQSAASATGPDLAAPTQSSDYVLFDPELMIAGIKLAFLEDKGFDTQKAQERYDAKLEQCQAKALGAPTLNLISTGATAVDRFIDNANLPLTGFGS